MHPPITSYNDPAGIRHFSLRNKPRFYALLSRCTFLVTRKKLHFRQGLSLERGFFHGNKSTNRARHVGVVLASSAAFFSPQKSAKKAGHAVSLIGVTRVTYVIT